MTGKIPRTFVSQLLCLIPHTHTHSPYKTRALFFFSSSSKHHEQKQTTTTCPLLPPSHPVFPQEPKHIAHPVSLIFLTTNAPYHQVGFRSTIPTTRPISTSVSLAPSSFFVVPFKSPREPISNKLLTLFNPHLYFYPDEHTNPPTITWEDPRPAYYMAQERGQYAPPPPGIQGQGRSSPYPQQVQQQQVVQTVNSDGTVTTITSNGQPIYIHQGVPQQQQQFQQQQQMQSRGPSLGTSIMGAAVVSSLLRPRPRVVVAPRRRRF